MAAKSCKTWPTSFTSDFATWCSKIANASIADDPTNFDGRVFTASQAVERGLVDSVGYLNDAIDAAAHLAGCRHVTATFYHRGDDRAGSVYSVTPNVPWQNGLLPLSLPGLDRSRLPTFLYLWQVEPTMEKLGGK